MPKKPEEDRPVAEPIRKGRLLELLKSDVALARVVPVARPARNRTVLGCGQGSVVLKGSLVEPLIPPGDWEMLDEEPS